VRVRLAVLGAPGPGASPGPELVCAIQRGLPAPLQAAEPVELLLDLEPCRDGVRGQVDAGCLVDRLPPPPPGWTLLGLTGADLFLPALTHVFGASRLGQRRGVLSWARLGDPPERLGRRLLVEAVHELGHSAGLVHCPVGDCAMHRTLWPEGIDLKRPDYCPGCRAALEGLEGP